MKDTEFLKEMGKKIKDLRLKKGYSQEELAKKMGYTSRSTINKIEKGLVDIPQSKILDFANVLDTTPLYLLNWSDNNFNDKNLIQIQRQNGQLKKYYLSNNATDEIIKLINKYWDKEQ